VRSVAGRLVALAVALGAVLVFALARGSPVPPYVVTAIDYHFHDAHPTFPIGPGRDLVVKNAGRNLHNVTIPALGFSADVRPGREIVIEDIASRFGAAGRYRLVCVIHQDRGMNGELVIVGE